MNIKGLLLKKLVACYKGLITYRWNRFVYTEDPQHVDSKVELSTHFFYTYLLLASSTYMQKKTTTKVTKTTYQCLCHLFLDKDQRISWVTAKDDGVCTCALEINCSQEHIQTPSNTDDSGVCAGLETSSNAGGTARSGGRIKRTGSRNIITGSSLKQQ